MRVLSPKIFLVVLMTLIPQLIAEAEILSPYVVDEKPQVLFGDSVQVSTYFGLENYETSYVNDYLRITFTYTHLLCCFAGYPPVVYVTDVDPRTVTTPIVKAEEPAYHIPGTFDWHTDWYSYEIQFDATGYSVVVKQAGEVERINIHKEVPGLSDTDWVSLANRFPIYILDDGSISQFSMSFTPLELKSDSNPSESDCCSNVLFLPGVMASRLFDSDGKIWEPLSSSSISKLYLDNQGESVRQDIYADSVIDEIFPVAGRNIYKSFLNDLDQNKSIGKIADYAAVPYDWRLKIPDILSADSFHIEQELRRLAVSSQTGKVTIVAHSNGGLIAKALLNSLDTEASDLVDQLIMVAVPQIGTPQAIGALLHGYDMGLPFNWLPYIMSPAMARDLASNMPSIYQLLPHGNYYSNPGVSVSTPIITFEEGSLTDLFISDYGLAINNNQELHNFIVGAEGRTAPVYGEVKSPLIGNVTLLSAAESLNNVIGALWQAPPGIAIHQIAGIGEDTLAGMTYKTGRECIEINLFTLRCREYRDTILYTPNEVIDGDGTVVEPSALAMTESGNIKRWWVNLNLHNRISVTNPRVFRKHKDILEIHDVRTLIFNNIISGATTTSLEFVNSVKPQINTGNRLSFILHSPLSLAVTDSSGNETNEFVSNVPGAKFRRYGEVQVVSVPAEVNPTLKLTGVSSGSFTLEIRELSGDNVVATTTFSGIPSATTTLVTLEFPNGTIENASSLAVDYDGDGENDFFLEPAVGEEVFLPIDEEVTLSSLIIIFKERVDSMNVNQDTKNTLLKYMFAIENNINPYQTILIAIMTIEKWKTNGRVGDEDAEFLIQLLNQMITYI